MSATAIIHSDPEILGGTPVFVGTRVPLRNLIDYLERGYSLDEFLDAFPSVSREQAVAALEAAHAELTAHAILLDEQLPRQLARELRGPQARTVQQQGWAGLTNGELLRRAAANGFEIFVAADRNLQFQQNLRGSPLGIIVLIAPSNALEDLVPLVPGLLDAVTQVRSGEIRQIAIRPN